MTAYRKNSLAEQLAEYRRKAAKKAAQDRAADRRHVSGLRKKARGKAGHGPVGADG